MQSSHLDELRDNLGVSVRVDVPGSTLTTFSIGGPVGVLVEPDDIDQLAKALSFLAQTGQSYRLLGFGSNSLLPDCGVEGWVIKLGRGFRYLDFNSRNSVVVGGAMSLMTLCRKCADQGLSGLEFAGGIPASLGGAVRMNAGAHGSEMAEIIRRVRVVDSTGRVLDLDPAELDFKYRSCSLPSGSIVVEVELGLAASDKESVNRKMLESLDYRRSTQPLVYPSAGSVFKNPAGTDLSAGAVIESLGLKGKKIGGAEISQLHANWIINPGKKAKDCDVISLIQLCQTMADRQLSVTLEPEVEVWQS